MTKLLSSFRLTDDARRLLKLIAAAMGLNLTSVLETLIREKAKKLGIK